MNLSLGLKTIAKRFPGCPAIEWEGGTLTYSEFERQVSELAYSLRDYHRLPRGAKIAMAMENCAEFLVILFAIWRADMTAIPLNSKLHPKEFLWVFKNSSVDLVFATKNIAERWFLMDR